MIRIKYHYLSNSAQVREITFRSEKEEKRWRQNFKPFVKVVKKEVEVCQKSNGASRSASSITVSDVNRK